MSYSIELTAIKEACTVLPRVGELTTIDNVAKYIGVSKMNLIKYIDANYAMFELKKLKRGKTVKTIIQEVYLTLAEKPNTKEWVMAQRASYANTIRIKTHTYYGYVCGREIVIDTESNATINLEEKVLRIVGLLGLQGPGWSYTAGGYGDSYGVKCKGYKVSDEDIEKIRSFGYNIIYN